MSRRDHCPRARGTALLVGAVVAWSVVVPGTSAATGPGTDAVAGSHVDAVALLERARVAASWPHAGRVTVVSFTDGGPRVSDLDVVVRHGTVNLRSPARVLVEPGAVTSTGATAPARTDAAGADTDAGGADTDAGGADTDGAGADTDAAGADPDAAGADTDAAGADTDAAGADTDAAGAETDATTSQDADIEGSGPGPTPATGTPGRHAGARASDADRALWSQLAANVPSAPFDVEVPALLTRWEATSGAPVRLDTGPATPVHLVRRQGAAVREVLYVDDESGLVVRRETRAPDGRVLRVVAYTELVVEDRRSAGVMRRRWGGQVPIGMASGHAVAAAAGFDVALVLGDGFVLASVDLRHAGSTAVARYTDGLSVLSVYQQHGALDPSSMDGAVVSQVASRDVWSWPGTEPVTYVWTGDGRTWTAVTDAPAPVIEGALRDLPGDLVGHDAPSRLRRGLDRVWRFVTAPLR